MSEDNNFQEQIDALKAQNDALNRKLNNAIERIEELEDEGSGGASTVSPYMNAVVDHTEPGQTVTRGDIERILRVNTNVSNPKTVREKVKQVTRMGPFERHADVNQTWVRIGNDDD